MAGQQQQMVIVQQPMSQGGMAAPQNVREWSTGLCGCMSDCGTCCYAYFCYLCFMCDLAGRIDECSCGPMCLGQLFIIAMRTKVRTMYGIRGSICKDCCAVAMCEFCSSTQMMRELKHMGK